MNNNLLPEVAKELGALLKEKNEAYGNSFEEAAKVLEILYPNGVPPDKYKNLLTVTRILDKLFRIVSKIDAFDENPWLDIAGYSILEVASKRSKDEAAGEGF
jgi:hypothetical protein